MVGLPMEPCCWERDIKNFFCDKITQGTVYIRVQGAEWLPALESLKQNFILELNSRTGKQLVSKIKLIT